MKSIGSPFTKLLIKTILISIETTTKITKIGPAVQKRVKLQTHEQKIYTRIYKDIKQSVCDGERTPWIIGALIRLSVASDRMGGAYPTLACPKKG